MSLFSALTDVFSDPKAEPREPLTIEACVAGLLLEAARMDNEFNEEECDALLDCLAESFDMSKMECLSLLDQATKSDHAETGVHRFVTHLNRQLDEEHRFTVLVQLWKVVQADGRIDALEKQFMRRIAALLHISDKDSGLARQEAVAASR